MPNGKTLIRGAFVLTMDEDLGTIRDGDIHIEDDRIIAVGRGLAADGAEVIDGTDCIVLPGFVDTHRHMWGAMLRGCACYGDLGTYFHDVVFTYGANYTPDDTYASARFGLAETIDAARALGLADVTGSLTPGKKADLILVRTDALNLGPLNVPAGQIVLAAQPRNVDSVWVDGVLRKRGGELVGVDVPGLVRGVKEEVAGLSHRIGKPVG